MNKQSFGEMISSLRKDRGMTQLDLVFTINNFLF